MRSCSVVRRICALALCAIALGAGAVPAVLPLPDDWYPESVAAGPDGSLYVGSWRQGAVVRLRPGAEPRPEVLVPPGANGLANAQGVLVDAQRGALWVCSGNTGFTTVPVTPSALKRYDLASGAAQASYPLPDAGYCNDLAQDAEGALYVTDSFHPRVLRLLPGAPTLAVWKEDPLLAGTGPYAGLNGIALMDDGAVVVSLVAAVPYLLRIARQADGESGSVQRLPAPRTMKNVDAIRAWGPGRLVLFESNAFGDGPFGGQISVARLQQEQGQDRLQLRTVVSGLNDPSSGVVLGNHVYFIESKYRLLTSHKDDPANVPSGVPFDLQSRELPQDGD